MRQGPSAWRHASAASGLPTWADQNGFTSSSTLQHDLAPEGLAKIKLPGQRHGILLACGCFQQPSQQNCSGLKPFRSRASAFAANVQSPSAAPRCRRRRNLRQARGDPMRGTSGSQATARPETWDHVKMSPDSRGAGRRCLELPHRHCRASGSVRPISIQCSRAHPTHPTHPRHDIEIPCIHRRVAVWRGPYVLRLRAGEKRRRD